jgi:AIPR protein
MSAFTVEESEPQTPLEEFAYNLHQEVLAKSADDVNPELREDVFTEIVLELLAEHNESDGAEVCYWNARNHGRTPAAKVNAWSLSGDGATLDLFVVLYHGDSEPESVPKSGVEQHYRQLRGFLRRALDGFHIHVEESNPVFEAMRRIYEARENLTTARLFFLTDGEVKSAEVEQEQISGYELRYVFWDIKKLSRLRVGERQTIELDFAKDYGGAIPALLITDATNEYRTFLAFLPAPMLARIYGEYGQRLLERNVRAFLQAKGKINRGLQQTLRDEPHRFLAYNNGLCCTAAEVYLDAPEDQHVRLYRVRDFQIVNGGQTTAGIYHAMKKERMDVSGVVVQMKLTVLNDPKRVADIVPLISKYANSQNKINAADFSANGPFHQQLEALSRSMWAPPRSGLERGAQWYYERARGSYMDDKARQATPARIRQWAVERPPEQKFTKTDLAKFEHTWLGLPHLVCRGAEKNFIEFAQRQEEDGAPVVTALYFQRLVAKAILWRTAEKLFSSLELPQFRAQSVAYGLAWLIVKSESRINLDRIWAEQRVPPCTSDGISAVLAAAHAYLESRPGNPSEAAKRPETWEEFQNHSPSLGESWKSELAPAPFVATNTEQDVLASEWEKLRHQFIHDARTLEALEAYTGKSWIRTRRRDSVAAYAALTWHQLRMRPGLGFKKIRDLVEMFAAALA